MALALLMLPFLGSSASADGEAIEELPTAEVAGTEERASVDEPSTVQEGEAQAQAAPCLRGEVSTFKQYTNYDLAGPGAWLNGNMNDNRANLVQGEFVWQQVVLDKLDPGTHELVFTYDQKIGELWAYDYVANFSVAGGSLVGEPVLENADGGPVAPSDGVVFVTVRFETTAAYPGTVTLQFGAHVASELDWGPGLVAAAHSGSAYHVSLDQLNCTTIGQQDNQIMASALDAGRLVIVKDAVPDDAQDFPFAITPGGAGGMFTLDDDDDATLTDTFAIWVAPGDYTVTETASNDWTLTDIVCSSEPWATGADVTGAGLVSETTTSGTIKVLKDVITTCTFTNSKAAAVVVDKQWVINDGDPVAEGQEPEELGLDATLSLTGPGGAAATTQPWGDPRDGYVIGETATLTEQASTSNPLCRLTGSAVTGGAEGGTGLPFDAQLGAGLNAYTITNYVTCGAELTLLKSVSSGPALPAAWTLTATAPSGALAGPSGRSGVSGAVTPDSAYTLSEAGDVATIIANYVQSGAWVCTDGAAVTGNQVVVPAGVGATCTVTNATAELTLKKVVTNDSGGTAVAADFPLSATPSSAGPTTYTDLDGSGDGTTVYVRPGVAYTLSENGVAGYELESLVCTRDGLTLPDVTKAAPTLTPTADDEIVCTFTNNDRPAHLTLLKEVVGGDTGTTAADTAWTLNAAGPTPISGVEGAESVTNAQVSAGTYTLTESGGPDGFSPSPWVCTKPGIGQSGPVPVTVTDGQVAVGLGENVTCEITNTAVAPTLTLVKVVVNQSGGELAGDDWTLTAEPQNLTGQADVTGPGGGEGAVVDQQVRAGTYALSESAIAGYEWSSLVCTNDGEAMPAVSKTSPNVTVGLGDDVTCTFTNTDKPSTLTLRKIVDANDTDSEASPSDWTLSAEPQDISGQASVSGPGDPEAPGGVKNVSVFAGRYVLAEADGPGGFTPGDWVCEGFATTETVDGVATVTIPNGADVVCEITNTATKPQLTLVKVVDNGSTGADAAAEDWLLTADGPQGSVISGQGGVDSADARVGTYALSESSSQTGYRASAWSCTQPSAEGVVSFPVTGGDTITLAEGDDVTCTITNTAIAPRLELVKRVVDGATGSDALPSAWMLTADGPRDIDLAGFGGAADHVVVGDYDLAESGGPSGYTASAWSCVDGSGRPVAMADDDTLSLGAGDDVTCTITNTATQPRLTLVKVVDNAGTGAVAKATDWTLEADGPGDAHDLSGAGGDSGAAVVGDYALSETGGPAGYDASAWTCTKAAGQGSVPVPVTDGTVTVGLGDDVTCTITNTAIAPHLELVKVVDNADTGATYDEEDWRLEAAGPVTIEGDGTASAAVSVGTYTLSESGPDGYDASDWVCLDESDEPFPGADGDAVTLELGDHVTCTITNTAITPRLKLVKEVDNGDTGADAAPEDWTLTADGPGEVVLSGAGGFPFTATRVGSYDLSESDHPEGPDSYDASDWECVDANGAELDTEDPDTVVLGLGDEVTCTITNTAVAPTLELVKEVDNGDTGADAEPTDWTLTADGPGDPLSGEGGFEPTKVEVGDYDLSESGDPAGSDAYTASDWECVDADGDPAEMVDEDTVELEVGDDVTCTITNSAVMPELTLVKVVDNGSTGASYDAEDWTLVAEGPDGAELSGEGEASDEVVAGHYDLSEEGPDGYEASEWECVDDDGDPAEMVDDDTVELEVGDDVTCTITNTAIAPELTLVKVVENGATGRTATPKDWTLVADGAGESGISGAGGASGAVPIGAYALAETGGPTGYTASAWQCTTGGTAAATAFPVVDNVVTLGLADDVTCTITNTATPIPPPPPPPPPGTASVQVLKVDGVTGSPIDTAKFKLWRDSGSTAGVLDALDSLVSPGEVSTGTSGNAVGTYLWSGLGQGAYLLQETAAPTGYDLSSPAVQAFTLTSAQVGTTVTKTVRNPQQDTTVEVVKVDDETGEVLEGARFQVYEDDGTTTGVLDDQDTPIGDPVTTDADGEARWPGLLFGSYLFEEVTAPAGYGLPEDPVQAVTITAANAGGVIALRFLDPALGALTLDKAAFELNGAGDWVASDGRVDFGDRVKYVVTATADGPKVHHDVVVSDFVPGYDPDDTTSDTHGTYVAGTAVCVDAGACTVTFDDAEQLLTWELGDLRDEARSVEFVIEFPEAGDGASMVEGVYTETLANTAAATWTDRAGDQWVDSNEVVVGAEIVVLPAEEERPPAKPRPPVVLPATGAPSGVGIWTTLGGFLLAVGALLMMRRRRDVS